jgi:hypothetical protein
MFHTHIEPQAKFIVLYILTFTFFDSRWEDKRLYIYEIIWEYQCVFHHNTSTTNHIFCICQVLENTNGSPMTHYIRYPNIKEAYDSVRREVSYNILIEFWGAHDTIQSD